MRDTTEHFKQTIINHLKKVAFKDPVFKEKLKNPDKTIDDCLGYIISEVKKAKVIGFTDEEIFGMATHYYDEEDLKKFPFNGIKVKINHRPDLTDDEKEELRQQARKEVIEAEKQKMFQKRKKSSLEDLPPAEQKSLF